MTKHTCSFSMTFFRIDKQTLLVIFPHCTQLYNSTKYIFKFFRMSRNVHFLCLAFKAIRQEDFIFVLTLIKTNNRNRCCLKKNGKVYRQSNSKL